MDKKIFKQSERWIIEYMGLRIDDARNIGGVWYTRSRVKIIKLHFQDAVRVIAPYETAEGTVVQSEPPVSGVRLPDRAPFDEKAAEGAIEAAIQLAC